MALIAHGGSRRFNTWLAYFVRPRTKTVAVQAIIEEEPLPTTHHYAPRRERFIESAAMGREMYRL